MFVAVVERIAGGGRLLLLHFASVIKVAHSPDAVGRIPSPRAARGFVAARGFPALYAQGELGVALTEGAQIDPALLTLAYVFTKYVLAAFETAFFQRAGVQLESQLPPRPQC